MVSNTKNIAVNIDTCVDNDCHTNCNSSSCQICPSCINDENLYHIREAYREHQRKGNFLRLFPSKIHYDDTDLISNSTFNNQISLLWFKGQCEKNIEWC